MSIVLLWRYVSKMKLMRRHERHKSGGAGSCGGTPIFLFFLFGVAAVVLIVRFAPFLAEPLFERFSVRALAVPALCALIGGGLFFGALLILPSAFALGALQAILVWRFFQHPLGQTDMIRWLPAVCAAVPVFFFMAFLGLRDSERLARALEASGESSKREAAASFILRLTAFAVLLLCFFFLHNG